MAESDTLEAATRQEWQKIARKVRMIDDLWTRLQHVKWSVDSLSLLDRMVGDLDHSAGRLGDDRFKSLVANLRDFLTPSAESEATLTATGRGRVSALTEALQQALPRYAALDGGSERLEVSPAEADVGAREVAIVTADAGFSSPLTVDLGEAGFRVRQYDSLHRAFTDLKNSPTAAVVCEASIAEGKLDGIQVMARLRKDTAVPPAVIFVSDRGDLAARLAATRAGAIGYYLKPVNTDLLLDRLRGTVVGVEGEGYRVLVVDDDPDSAELTCAALAKAGIVAESVVNPVQLLQVMYRFQPDLVLMDVHLGDVTGIELARVLRIHESYSDVPIVFISGDDSSNVHLGLLRAGGDDFLVKPVTQEHLLAAVINRLCRARDSGRRNRVLSGQDAVSHLANRRRFVADLERLLPGVGIGIPYLAVMLIYVDNFRALRERAGIAGCDRVLVQVGRRLKRAVRPGDLVARYGDAGFAILTLGHDEEELRELGAALHADLEKCDFDAGGRSFMLSATIGATVTRHPEVEALSLIEHTELAVRIARDGGSPVYVHDPGSGREAQRTREEELAAEIKECIEQSRLRLLFQPIVGFADDRHERYEVLVRMRDSAGDELLPETAFAIAERVGLGVQIDRAVVARVLEVLSERTSAGRRAELFVNVCPDLFQDHEFPGWLGERIASHGISAQDVVFEVPEGILHREGRRAAEFIENVRRVGCRASIERFGKREDALILLSRAPVDYVKLDRTVVEGIEKDRGRLEDLLRLLTSVRKLGPEIIAGGVEDPSTLGALYRCDIKLAQGFFLQEPFDEMSYDFSGDGL